jgi:hypothetical protein
MSEVEREIGDRDTWVYYQFPKRWFLWQSVLFNKRASFRVQQQPEARHNYHGTPEIQKQINPIETDPTAFLLIHSDSCSLYIKTRDN